MIGQTECSSPDQVHIRLEKHLQYEKLLGLAGGKHQKSVETRNPARARQSAVKCGNSANENIMHVKVHITLNRSGLSLQK